MLLWMVAACQINSRPACDIVRITDLADDEASPAGSADELLEVVGHDGPLEGQDPDGKPVTVDLFVGRGTGRTQWVEQEESSIETRRFGLGRTHLGLAIDCPDMLVVPLVGELRVDSEGVGIRGLAGEVARPLNARLDPVTRVELTGSLDDATLPDADPSGYQSVETFLGLEYEKGELIRGWAGWTGQVENGSDSEYVVILGE